MAITLSVAKFPFISQRPGFCLRVDVLLDWRKAGSCGNNCLRTWNDMWPEYLKSSWRPEIIKYHSNNLNPVWKLLAGKQKSLKYERQYIQYNTSYLCWQNAEAVSQMWNQINFGDGQTQMFAWNLKYHHCSLLKCFKWCKKEDVIIYNKDIHIVMNYLSWPDAL